MRTRSSPARWRPRLAITTAAACVLTSLGPSPASGTPGHVAQAAPIPAGAPGHVAQAAPVPAGVTHTVTLLTGDRVQYGDRPDGTAQVTVDPAARADRPGLVFTTATTAGPGGRPGLYVVPSDAQSYLAAGVVDRELFNVRELTREGLEDGAAGTLPVIVTYRGQAAPHSPDRGRATARPPDPGAATARPPGRGEAAGRLPAVRRAVSLPAIDGAALRVDRHDAAGFWAAIGPDRSAGGPTSLAQGVAKVWLDRRVAVSLDRSVPQIGAPAAWQAGYDGTGVTVAVLDTGLDAGHPDLAGKVAAAMDFTDAGTTADGHGHGTHVASTIAGSGAASGGRYKGVAPGARLMVGKVLDDEGFGLDSAVIGGMDWAAHGGAKVVSMSLGGPPTDGTDPLSEAVDALSAETGALFVVAAGNFGAPLSVGAPGTAAAALTVGAVDRSDHLADFSSRGPRWGDGAVKPEITAPGVGIVAARAAGTGIGDPVDDRYTALSGTSMATPHVAGAAAILAQRHPAWLGGQLKDGLVSSAADIGTRWAEAGSGRVAVDRAVRQEVTGPAAINLGQLDRTGGPVHRTVEYVNDGTRPISLDLRASVTTWAGRPAPTGIARLSAASVSVPAGGRGSVDLVVDPAAVTSGGVYGGTVQATSTDGAVRLSSTFSAYVPAGTATVTVRVVNHRGEPTPVGVVTLVDAAYDPANADDPFATALYEVPFSGGTGTAQVRRGGVYTAITSQGWYRLDTRRADVMLSPEVRVDGDTEIVLDARRGQQHQVTTADPTDSLYRATEVVRGTAGAVVSVLAAVRADPDLTVSLTPTPVPRLGFLTTYDKRTLATAGLRTAATGRDSRGVPATIALHPRYDPFTAPAKLAGSRVLPLVAAGEGKPGDLAGLDLRGKLALVGVRAPADGPDAVNAALAAATAASRATADAGAFGIVLYVDATGAAPLPRAGTNPIPQLFVSRDEGALLRDWLGRGPVSVGLAGTATPHAMYNLFYPHDGIPAGHEHKVVGTELVAIPTRYHADRPMTYEKNYFVFGTHSLVALRERILFQAPAAVLELIGPGDPTVRWHRWVTQNESPPPKIFTLISNDVFAAGDRLKPEERWFEGPVLEGEPAAARTPSACGMCRGGPDGDLLVPAWRLGDSTDTHFVQSWPDYRSDVHLFRGATEIPSQPQTGSLPLPTYSLPAQPDTYRLVVDGPTPRNPALRAIQHTTTEWTFRSARPAPPDLTCPGSVPGGCAHQPLIQLRYRLGLDLANRAPAGQPMLFEVTAGPPPQAQNAGTVAGLWLWSSTDAGASWRPAWVVPLGSGRFRVLVRNPVAVGGDGTVWLKAEAWDTAGNRVRQTVRGAYTLATP